jgi:hypothetical protein
VPNEDEEVWKSSRSRPEKSMQGVPQGSGRVDAGGR